MKKGIKFKFLSILSFLLILSALNSIWAITNFRRLNDSIDNILKQNYDSIIAVQEMMRSLENQNRIVTNHLLFSGDTTEITFRENESVFLMWLARAEDNITEDGEKQILNNIRDNYNNFLIKYNSFLLNKTTIDDEELKQYYIEVNEVYLDTIENCKELLDLNQDGMMIRKNQSHDVAINATFSTIVIAIITVVIGFLVSILLTNKITKPLKVLIEKIKKISQGNYAQQLDISGSDEISELSNEFNTMTKKLQLYQNINLKKLMTEKQKAEAIVESISDGIIVTNDEHKLILVNRAAEKALNIREKDVLNLHFLESIKEDEIFQIIKKVHSSKEFNSKYYKDIVITNDKLNQEHFRVYVKPIIIRKENIGVVTLLQNITKLKEVDRIKSDFISTVSHEFRTPLTSINMAIGLLLDNDSIKYNNNQVELLGAIQEDTVRLNNLVTDLLDFSKIESGKIQMDLDKCDINNVIENAIKPFGIQASEKNIKILNLVSGNLQLVNADFNKITWVLTNLIGNALRYVNDDGTGLIEIDAKQTANKMLISVSDNGIGIPEDIQDKIFDKFIQSNINDQNNGSAGLGLAICKEIIRAHYGDIWVESKLGEGSTFLFTLDLISEK